MYNLSRGQIVGLITIAIIFALTTLVFDKIIDHQAEKKEYLTFDKTKATTLLKGSSVEYINLGETYQEKGLNTNQDYTISYFQNNNEVASINTSEFGTYQIYYYIKGENPIHRTLIVIDKQAPSIAVPNKQTITSIEAMSFDLTKDVIATDNSGNVTLTYENTLSTIPGEYIITYKATDNSGNKTYRKRLIKVEDGIEFNIENDKLTITYPSQSDYTYKYSVDGGTTFIPANKQTTIQFTKGTIIATVYKDNNYIMASSFTR